MPRFVVVSLDPLPLSELTALTTKLADLLGADGVMDPALAQRLGVRFAFRGADGPLAEDFPNLKPPPVEGDPRMVGCASCSDGVVPRGEMGALQPCGHWCACDLTQLGHMCCRCYKKVGEPYKAHADCFDAPELP